MTVLTDSSRNPHLFITPQKAAILIVAATFHFWYKLMWQWGHKHKLPEAILLHSCLLGHKQAELIHVFAHFSILAF